MGRTFTPDGWKKKEQAIVKNVAVELERREMEQKSKSPYWLWTGDVFALDKKSIRTAQTFIVHLRGRLAVEEIEARMLKGFGDLKE